MFHLEDFSMRCKYTNSQGQVAYRTVTWRLFYPRCPKVNFFCNPVAGAYVAAITVCAQRLW